jgi:hypothetical protein
MAQIQAIPQRYQDMRSLVQAVTPVVVAKRAGMSRSMLSRILHGKRRPDGLLRGSTAADRLATVLGLSLEELGKFCDWAEKTGGIKL